METNIKITIEMPARLKRASEEEALRRGITLNALVRNYLTNFLSENIDNTIFSMNKSSFPMKNSLSDAALTTDDEQAE